MWLRSARIITPAGVRAGSILINGGRIADVRLVNPGDGPHGGDGLDPDRPHRADEPHRADGPDRSDGLGPEDGLELGDRWIAPGFIDTHVHGGGGAQSNTSDPDEILAVARFHAAHGTTSLLATTVAAPVPDLEAALRAIAAASGASGASAAAADAAGTPNGAAVDGAAVLGAHLEGPFLSRAHPGAMDPARFLLPSREICDRLLAVGPRALTMMTIAPELPGALELTATLANAGVVVSLGHSDATYEESRAAAQAGAAAVTHLFNAMRPMHHRNPGIVGAALDLPELSCELICDGNHVAAAMLRVAARAKGLGGIRLVTDAIEAAGMPDGDYRLGGGPVSVRDGRAVVPQSDRLAGSTLTMQDAVRNAVSTLRISVEAAVSLASANPAALLGIADRKGSIAAGWDADLVVLDKELRVERTMVAGRWMA